MAQFKKFVDLKGIDVRNNDLLRREGYLRDALNVFIDDSTTRGIQYRKRPGFFDIAAGAGTNGLFNYATDDVLVILSPVPGLWDGISTSVMNVKIADPMGVSDEINVASIAQINEVAYIAKENRELLKYDGNKIYSAGMPTLIEESITQTSNASLGGYVAGDQQYIFELEYADFRENGVVGGELITETITTIGGSPDNYLTFKVKPKVSVSSASTSIGTDPLIAGFNGVQAVVTARFPVTPGTGDASDPLVIPVSAGHSLAADERVWIRHTNDGFETVNPKEAKDFLWESLKVLSITATTISLDNPLGLTAFIEIRNEETAIDPYDLASSDPTKHNLEITYLSSVLMNVYKATGSPLSEHLYFDSLGVELDGTTIDFVDSGVGQPRATNYITDPKVIAEFINEPPVQAKFVEYHKDLLILGGIQERVPKASPAYNYNSKPHEIAYSSTEGLEDIESFPLAGNRLIIGSDDQGIVTGLKSHNDHLIIFKENAIHHIAGNLITGAFRIDEVHGSEVGCVSHDSIQEVNGAVAFLSKKGVFVVVGGGTPVNLSESITPLFEDTLFDTAGSPGSQLYRATSTFSFKEESYYLFIPFTGGGGRMFVYNYHYTSWLVWDMLATDGMALYRNELYTIADDNLYRQQAARTDDVVGLSAAINAYIFSNFEHFGEPSIYKKVINLKAFALNSNNFDLTVESYKDWDDATVKTSDVINFTATQRFDKVKVLAGDNKAHSFAVKFSNNIDNEDLELTGWELEVETPYKKMKQ